METINSNSADSMDKTVSFKLPTEEAAQLKEVCEQMGIAVSDHLRQLLRGPIVQTSSGKDLPQDLQVRVDLQLANAELTQLRNLIAQLQQALEQECTKRKKFKKLYEQATAKGTS